MELHTTLIVNSIKAKYILNCYYCKHEFVECNEATLIIYNEPEGLHQSLDAKIKCPNCGNDASNLLGNVYINLKKGNNSEL